MTMIAAFRSMGVPALIGDFLLTRGEMEAGSRKKLTILSPRLAVGWTGHLISAQQAVAQLKKLIAAEEISKISLEEMLTSAEMENFGDGNPLSCVIVGWVVDPNGESHCFRWRTDFPSTVFFGDPMYDGSGDVDAQAMLKDGPTMSGGTITDSAVRMAICGAASMFTNRELLPVVDRSGYYGIAFEAIVWGGDGFEYITDVLHYQTAYFFDEEGKFKNFKINPRQIRLRHHDGGTEVTIFQHNDGAPRDVNVHIIQDIVQAPGYLDKKMKEFERNVANEFDFSYSIGSEESVFVSPNFETPVYMMRDKSKQVIELGREKDIIQWNPAELEEFYRAAFADAKSRKE